MTIAREIREKIVKMHLEGYGRNKIAQILNERGIKISQGSVGNIIRSSFNNSNSGNNNSTSMEPEVKHDNSIQANIGQPSQLQSYQSQPQSYQSQPQLLLQSQTQQQQQQQPRSESSFDAGISTGIPMNIGAGSPLLMTRCVGRDSPGRHYYQYEL